VAHAVSGAGMTQMVDVVAFVAVALAESAAVALLAYAHAKHCLHATRTDKGADVLQALSSLLTAVRPYDCMRGRTLCTSLTHMCGTLGAPKAGGVLVGWAWSDVAEAIIVLAVPGLGDQARAVEDVRLLVP
jgi:hypothetical protein